MDSSPVPTALPRHQLRRLAHTRRVLLAILPLGAAVGGLASLAVRGTEGLSEALDQAIGGWAPVLPLAALVAATLWLTWTGLGPVSLFEDLDLARQAPEAAFPLQETLGKVVACGLTIALGGSTGLEGPAKWLGAALGVQFSRVLRWLSHRAALLRRLKSQPGVMVISGEAAALAVVFRAPLSAALFAAEHDGVVSASALVPAVVASAAAYVTFVALAGAEPLLPGLHPYGVNLAELLWAVPLGLACGLGASLFLWTRRTLDGLLSPLPLWLRGLVGGTGLLLLMLPARSFFHGLPITPRGGLPLIQYLLAGGTPARVALLFLGLKALATALTLAGGGVGGLWLPATAMGACLGSAFDAWLLPAYPGLMTMIGAAAFAGACHRTLLVPVAFLAETTGQAPLVVPGLVACTLAFLMVRVRPK